MKKVLVPLAIVATLSVGGYVWYRSLPTPLEKGRQALARGDVDAAVQILSAALGEKEWGGPMEENLRAELARGYMLKGAFDSAEDQFRRVLEKSPKNFHAQLGLGFVNYARGFEAYALDAFIQAKRADPNDVRAPLALASLYRERRDFERARQEYLAILLNDPTHRLARQGLADTLLEEGAFPEAVTELEQILEVFPNEPAARLSLIRAFLLSGQYARAEREVRSRAQEGRDDFEGRWLLAAVYEATGRWEEAREAYEKIYKDSPMNRLAGVRLAAVSARTGRLEQARALLEQFDRSVSLMQQSSLSFSTLYEAWDAFKSRNDLQDLLVALRLAWGRYYTAQANYPDAEKAASLALQIDGNKLEALRFRTELHRLRNEPEERLKWAKRTADVYPRHPQALLDRAEALLRLRRFSESERDVLAARASCPSLDRAAAVLSRILLARGKIAEARAAAEEALSLHPGSSPAHVAMGLVRKGEQDWKKAEAALRAAAQFDPYNAEAHFELGRLLSSRKKTAEAQAAFRRAASLEPLVYPAPR